MQVSNVSGARREEWVIYDLEWTQDSPGIVDILIDDVLWNPDGFEIDGTPHTGNFNYGLQGVTIYGLDPNNHVICVNGECIPVPYVEGMNLEPKSKQDNTLIWAGLIALAIAAFLATRD